MCYDKNRQYSREQMDVFRNVLMGPFLLVFDENRFYQVGRYVYDKLHPSYKIDVYVNGYYTNLEGPGERPKNILDFLHNVEGIRWGYIYALLSDYILHMQGNVFNDDGSPPALRGKPLVDIYWEREDGSVGNWGNRFPVNGNDATRAYQAAIKNLKQYKNVLCEEDYKVFLDKISKKFKR